MAFAGAQAAPLFLLKGSAPTSPLSFGQKAAQKSGKLIGSFDKAEMEAMVTELSLYIPQNPNLAYPIDCDFVETKQVNAYATTKDVQGSPKPQPVMRILTGILSFIDDACAKGLVVGLDPNDPTKKITLKPGDERRLLRAVVAHELGHLSKGHVLRGKDHPKGRDMGVLYTRETEQEADMVGAAALQRSGYSRADAEHMLMMLEAGGGGSVADNLMGDHADGKRRAIAVAEDPKILKALVEFDLGLAFAEIRGFKQATAAFDRAAVKEPKLTEAYINAAQTATQDYYQNLSRDIRNKWFRPDFGPLLVVLEGGRGGLAITPADERNYAEAERHATIALQKAPNSARAIEIAGLIGVLHPQGNASSISNGITNLNKALSLSMDPGDRIRIANNLAVAYQRSGDVTKGTDLLVETFKITNRYNSAGAYNLGFAPFPETQKENAGVATATMYLFLKSTPKLTAEQDESPDYKIVKDRYDEVTKKYGVQKQALPDKGPEISLLQVFSIVDGGQEIALLADRYPDVEKKLGKGEVTAGILASGEDRVKPGQAVGMFETKFRNGQVIVIFNTRTGEQEVVRVTSYSPGAYLELRPRKAEYGETFRVTVGMDEKALYARVPEDSAASARLFRVGTLEDWSYFPGLNFGVQIKDGKIAGITATPAK